MAEWRSAVAAVEMLGTPGVVTTVRPLIDLSASIPEPGAPYASSDSDGCLVIPGVRPMLA